MGYMKIKRAKGRKKFMKIFEDTGKMQQSAYFGWQDKNDALLGLREGYKNSADDLVDIALENGNSNKTLDTYIFPILFSYRHSIELSIKHIYMRAKGSLPKGGHDLLILWNKVKREVIDELINLDDLETQVEIYKKEMAGIPFSKIFNLLKELQESNQSDEEVNPSNKQIDQHAEVWRYLMTADCELFFTCSHSIDYVVLKEGFNFLYDVLDYIYEMTDKCLSS